MTDRLPRSVTRTRKAATGAGTFNTNAVNEIANAKSQNATRRWAAGGTALPSDGDSIKVSDCCPPASSGVVAHTNPVNTTHNRTEVAR
jgi:hypothetical protein